MEERVGRSDGERVTEKVGERVEKMGLDWTYASKD